MRSLGSLVAGVLAFTVLSSPALAQFPGEPSAVVATNCDYKCLTDIVRGYMDALGKRDPTRARLASNVRFTENNVELSLGHEGLWTTVSGIAPSWARTLPTWSWTGRYTLGRESTAQIQQRTWPALEDQSTAGMMAPGPFGGTAMMP